MAAIYGDVWVAHDDNGNVYGIGQTPEEALANTDRREDGGSWRDRRAYNRALGTDEPEPTYQTRLVQDYRGGPIAL